MTSLSRMTGGTIIMMICGTTLLWNAVVDDASLPQHMAGPDASTPSALDGRIETFRNTWYPDTSDAQWDNWHFQLSHRITTVEDLSRFLTLTEEEQAAFASPDSLLSFAITPHYLSLIDPTDPSDALRACVVPTIAETYPQRG